MIKIESCPDAVRMRDHACANRAQCWEPCGLLGKSEVHARVMAEAEDAQFLTKADAARVDGFASPEEVEAVLMLSKVFPSGGPLSGAQVED